MRYAILAALALVGCGSSTAPVPIIVTVPAAAPTPTYSAASSDEWRRAYLQGVADQVAIQQRIDSERCGMTPEQFLRAKPEDPWCAQ